MATELLTIGGTLVDLEDPKPGIEKLKLWEVAHCLSLCGRYSGNTFRFYSVAQHSVLAAEHVADYIEYPEDTDWVTTLRRTALFHDAAEMFMGDVPGPLKRMMGGKFKAIEHAVEEALAARFDLMFPFPKVIKTVDLALLQAEMRDITAGDLLAHEGTMKVWEQWWPEALTKTIEPWTGFCAYREFLAAARQLGIEQ